MKKFLTLFILSAFIKINGQSFYKGALVIDAGGGLEIYNTKVVSHDKTNNLTETKTDKAGNTHFTVGAEYGLHKRFGIGLRYKNNNYFVSKDTISGNTGTVKSNDILVQLNFHAVSKKSFDLVLGTDVGYTGIKYHFNDTKNTQLSGSGIYYSFYIEPRLYIGRFGFNMKLYLPFFNYPKLTTNDPDFNKTFSSFKLQGSPGFGLSFGIQYRFLDAKDDSKK